MSTQRGAVAESMFCTWALRTDYDVCFPARGTSPSYDVVLLRDSTFTRVQVKRAHPRGRNPNELRVSLTDRAGHKYKYGTVDAFAVVDVDGQRIWLFPVELFNGKSLGLSGGKHDHWMVYDGNVAKDAV